MKLIFLDIDGVLNTKEDSLRRVCLYNPGLRRFGKTQINPNLTGICDLYGQLFSPSAVGWLAHIIRETDAKIVISSTWRYSGLSEMQQMWKYRSLPGEVIAITEDSYRATTGHEDTKYEDWRGAEIDLYLRKNPCEGYCIIDDDRDMLPSQMTHFVHCDAEFGIREKEAKLAIVMLNRKTC